MEVVRQFKKMSLWDFIDLMEQQCFGCAKSSTYFMYLDEIKMRRIESISEGGNFKLRSLAAQLLAEYKKELKMNPSFSSAEDLASFTAIVENEI